MNFVSSVTKMLENFVAEKLKYDNFLRKEDFTDFDSAINAAKSLGYKPTYQEYGDIVLQENGTDVIQYFEKVK